MATGPTLYNGGYVQPPATPDAQWIAAMRAANPGTAQESASILARVRAMLAGEQGSTNLFTPGGWGGNVKRSLGSLEDMQAARAQALMGNGYGGQINPATAIDQVRAQLAAQEQAAGAFPQMGSASGLSGQAGNFPNFQLQGPRALSSGPALPPEPNVIPSSGQAFPMGPAGGGGAASSGMEMVPYSGGGAAGAAPIVEEAAAKGGSIFSKAKGAFMDAGGVKGALSRGATVGLPVYIGSHLAAPIVGAGVDHFVPGTGGAASKAVGDMGTGFAAGYTVVGPVGGIVGMSAAGANDVVQGIGDLGKADSYDGAVGDFTKRLQGHLFESKSGKATALGGAFKQAALAIHNGKDFAFTLPNGQQIAVPGSQLGSGSDNLDAKTAAMNNLVSTMSQYATEARMGNKQAKQSTKDDAALALKMGNAMASLMQPYTDQSVAASGMLRGLESQVPESARPLLEAQAGMNDAYAKQMQGAYVGAAAAYPLVNHMDAQIAQQQQLLQQIQAARSAGSSGSSGLNGALQSPQQAAGLG